jgi:hypothetical protein
MLKRQGLGVCLFLLASCLSVFAQGSQQNNSILIGVISVKGNEPFTYVALTEANGHVWKLTGKKVQELKKDFQNKEVLLNLKEVPSYPESGLPPKVEVISYRLNQ